MTSFRLQRHLWWLIPLILADVFFFNWWLKRIPVQKTAESGNVLGPDAGHGCKSAIKFTFPTDRALDRSNLDAFQPTASGRPESAFYGSVRTAKNGLPSFHEGIDIAPLKRDKAGRAQDPVMATANGTIAYINRHAGNSNYGKYVVLAHGAAPAKIYTLYAHLAKIAPGLNKNGRVPSGASLGIMGATSTDYIAPDNAHLHFEIALMLNSRFDAWFRKQKLAPDHGLFHGWNLIGIDPLEVYAKQAETNFNLFAHIRALPSAFTIALKTNRQTDYFRRYAFLWRGHEFNGGAMIIKCSENGLPLSGRNANEDEIAALRRRSQMVCNVDQSVLGRNGSRLVVAENGKWRLSNGGKKWLAMLVY